MSARPQHHQSLEVEVVHARGKAQATGTLRLSGTTLTFAPYEPGGEQLAATIDQIDWVRRTTKEFRVKAVDQATMYFRLAEQHLDRDTDTALQETRTWQAEQHSPDGRMLDAIPERLFEHGVSVRQSIYHPLQHGPPFRPAAEPIVEIPHADTRGSAEVIADGARGALFGLAGLPLVFAATSIHFILIAPFAAALGLGGNVFGLNSDSIPRSWVELAIEVLLILYGVTYFVFARRYLPRWKWLQFSMAIAPLVGFIVWVVWEVST